MLDKESIGLQYWIQIIWDVHCASQSFHFPIFMTSLAAGLWYEAYHMLEHLRKNEGRFKQSNSRSFVERKAILNIDYGYSWRISDVL